MRGSRVGDSGIELRRIGIREKAIGDGFVYWQQRDLGRVRGMGVC